MSDSAPQRAPEPLAQDLTGATVGRFLIRRLLGQGGMGQVYEAEDTRLKRPVALKRMAPQLRADEQYRRRFLKEAECASRLTHQHIAGIYDVFEQGGEVFLVMEFVAGETLRERLKRPFPVDEVVDVFSQCATALVAAQEQGIVHRDIKPENIMLTPSLQAKILDFGVARVNPGAGKGTTQSILTTSGGMAGTLPYMPPEALLEKTLDGRADIYSLGVTLYEVVTGQHPFLVDGALNTMDRILRYEPVQANLVNQKVPAEMARIISKTLSKDPADRYATSADLLVDLRTLHRAVNSPILTGTAPVSGKSVSFSTAPPPLTTQPQPLAEGTERRTGAAIKALIGVAAAGILAVGLYFYTSGRGSRMFSTAPPAAAQPVGEVAPGSGSTRIETPPVASADTGPAATPPRASALEPAAPPAPASPPAAALAKPPAAAKSGNASPVATQPKKSAQPRSNAPVGSDTAADAKEKPYVTPGSGDVEIISDVLGAKAVLSAEDGKTQECISPCKFEDLKPGRYALQVTKDGYRISRRVIDLRAGKLASETLTLDPQKASLDVSSDPPQAEIFVNGEKQNSLTPATITLAPGTYRIALQKTGYGRYEGSVTLKDEDIRGLNFQLRAEQGQQTQPAPAAARPGAAQAPAGAMGFLDLRTVPPGADILVDGSSTGQKTPFRLQVPAGQHTVTLFLRGYRSAQKPITVQENQTLTMQEILAAQ